MCAVSQRLSKSGKSVLQKRDQEEENITDQANPEGNDNYIDEAGPPHAHPEGNGPQHSKERGRRGSTGPPQPEQRRQKHHQYIYITTSSESAHAPLWTVVERKKSRALVSWGWPLLLPFRFPD